MNPSVSSWTWVVKGGWTAKTSVANTAEWGTDRRSALDLLEDALNLRTPTVYDHDARENKDILNPTATEAARDKQEKIKERFKEWIWQEDERRERLVHKYNEEFNCIRLRTFNGEHLTLPGASPAIALRPHQKASVWRILQTPNTLLAHVVGAGKTYTMVASAMEFRRLGLARKPLFAVPNHMLGQFSSELLTLYPGANILVASKDDFEKQKRKTLMSRIATGNWDAVIVTHSGFEKIPVAKATQEEFFKSQLRELALAIEEQRQQENSRIVKELERAKKKLETKLKELAGGEKKDDVLAFEELGVDRLFVDEAHYFKNLFYISKMTRIAGLPATASQRAFDMLLKVQHIQRINGGGAVICQCGGYAFAVWRMQVQAHYNYEEDSYSQFIRFTDATTFAVAGPGEAQNGYFNLIGPFGTNSDSGSDYPSNGPLCCNQTTAAGDCSDEAIFYHNASHVLDIGVPSTAAADLVIVCANNTMQSIYSFGYGGGC